MSYFHYRCGERITLLNDNCTAVRNDCDFDNGLVITAEPILTDILFEIKIDRKVNSWSGSLEIGVVDCDPLRFEFPACSSKINAGSWILSGSSFFRNGNCMVERYCQDLDKLNQDDLIGLMRTNEGDLIFYINGESQGVAAQNVPALVYGIVDVYGKCVQISITSPALREHNNDDCLSGSSVLAIDNDILNVTLGGDISELSMSSSNSLDIRMDNMNVSTNNSLSLPDECPRSDRLRFHDRCGSLVKLTCGNRSAERRRPMDEFNNGVVMTQRPLRDTELFEIRIDRLVGKWSGSIEMGITTHNPNTLVFPATMTNMRSGTIMMSGCGILTNGKGTRREYGDFNLDELSEGDRVGMMRKPDGNLHYFINGLDQGVAAQRVPATVWGVIDLYGMTIKVTIVERDEREEQNLMTRRNTRDQHQVALVPDPTPLPDYYDRLTFHPDCGTHAQVINNGRTAHRPNAADDFNNGVVLTARALKTGELFEVRLDRVVSKWAGSIEIGVTTHSPIELEFPFTMTNVRSGTWMMTGSGIMHNGTIVLEQYGVNLDRLQVGDRVGVVRKENGLLHFFVNGIDQGAAATNVPDKIFGVIDLYGQAVGASIVDVYDYGSPDTINSSLSNTTLYSDVRFHHVHGKNARIVNNGLTAVRPRPLAEFNDAIVFSSRPLRDGELFEVGLDCIVDRWSGSIELGVTAVRPDDIELPSTATDLCRDTWMLSGSSVMENGKTIKNNYPLDLDTLTQNVRLGVVRSADKTLEFYRNGVPQGAACVVPHGNVYAVVDLYGQCSQVSIPCVSPLVALPASCLENCPGSDTSVSLQAAAATVQAEVGGEGSAAQPHTFSEHHHGKAVLLSNVGRTAARTHKDHPHGCGVVYGATALVPDEIFEISVTGVAQHLAGSLVVGVTDVAPSATCPSGIPKDSCYLTGNELKYKDKTIQLFTPSLDWLFLGDTVGLYRTRDGNLNVFINGEELSLSFPPLPETVYVFYDLSGTCASIRVISKQVPVSSMLTCRMQDSLDLVVAASDPNELLTDVTPVPQPTSTDEQIRSTTYDFHENHGRNIELVDGKTSARRVASYNQGLVIVQPPLEPEAKVQVVVDVLDARWQSSIMVALVPGTVPEKLNLPVNALALKAPCCVVASDWISINGIKSRSNYGQRLAEISSGDTVGVMLTAQGMKLLVNGLDEDVLLYAFPPNQPVYAVFDLYGQCQQIKILNDVTTTVDADTPPGDVAVDFEKADLESCEKERALTLPLTGTVVAGTSLTTSSIMVVSKTTPVLLSPAKSISCAYREECVKFKKKMFLPDYFFTADGPVCYCANCHKILSQADDKDESLLGWIKFPLKISNSATVVANDWHVAFYPTKIGAVRCILDRGQPLTKGQAQYNNLVPQKEDDEKVVFYPTITQNCLSSGYKMTGSKTVHVAFQLLVKPSAYSISSNPTEWSTKETGAIALHALLIHIAD